MIIAGALNLKMAASGFVSVTDLDRGSDEHDKENSIPNSTNDAGKFGVTVFKRKT